MAVKTFSVGETLTASDTNTYLANAGLIVVTPSSVTNGTLSGAKVTIGSATSSVTVNGVFSATYDAYRIVVNGSTSSAANNNVYLKFNNSTGSTYNVAGWYMIYTSSTVNGVNRSASNVGIDIALTGTTSWSLILDVFNPFASAVTNVVSHGSASAIVNNYIGYDSNAASQTGFSLSLSAGTMTGGTIMTYGYRLG